MPRDLIETPETKPDTPDLSKPSLPGLIYLLEHPELWPNGFKYNWTEYDGCGWGLAHRVWGENAMKHIVKSYAELVLFFDVPPAGGRSDPSCLADHLRQHSR